MFPHIHGIYFQICVRRSWKEKEQHKRGGEDEEGQVREAIWEEEGQTMRESGYGEGT